MIDNKRGRIRRRYNRQRRGLSTIVGGVFMVLVIAAGINVTLWSLQQQDRVTTSIIEKTDSKLASLNEKLEISEIRTDNNKFNITISNGGSSVANLTSIYIVNETASPKEQYRYDLADAYVSGRNSITNIGQSLPLTIENDTTYSIKVISESGNSVSQQVTPLSSAPLQMSMYVIPPTITTKQNVTILFAVTNNGTEPNFKRPVTPILETPELSCTPPNCSATLKVAPPSGVTYISQGSTALFKWVYYIEAPEDTSLTFNATIADASQGNYVVEKGLVTLIEESQTSFVSETTIVSNLVQKPEIFIISPNPFGESTEKGLWGAVIANPTEQTMDVRKVVIAVYSPRGQTNDIIFDIGAGAGDGCDPSNINPNTGSWECPVTNVLIWEATNTPLSIPGRSVQPFLVMVNPGSLSKSGSDLDSFSINVSVFTSMGQFAKSGYSGSMRNGHGAMANVYLSKTVNSTSTTDIIGNVSSIRSLSQVILNATIADFDNNTTYKINSGTRLIIDIPKGFTQVEVLSSGGFTVDAPTEYPDGSWQIIGTLNTDLTGESGSAVRTIQFKAIAPEEKNEKRIYLMYILADGTSDGTDKFSVGAIAEAPLQIIPSP